MKTIAQRKSGFTLVEILIIIATVAFLAIVLLPMLARSRSRSSGIGCTSCLKQIGLAFRLYANDHNDRFPFVVPLAAGGTLELTNSPQVFRHFQAMSNELVTPKVLVCSRDRKRKPPTPNSARVIGFDSIANKNISYFVALDADEAKPERLLSGDRNITGGIFTNGFLRLLKTNSPAGWTKELQRGRWQHRIV